MCLDATTYNCYIPVSVPNWNEYINAERTNRHLAAKIKRQDKEIVSWTCKGRYQGTYPAQLTVKAHYKHKRGDLDNVRYKGILDGLVSAGVIENDNLTKIQRIVIEPVFDGIEGLSISFSALRED